ncbi:hypothetical protein Ddc_18296 [Ditylenchus destructor]|nr:hypothetical protein Ddc_18296 [Ditylenchus destructor]
MSNSKLLPPFTYDLLCYLNREQLERFSIVCRYVKNFIDRYFRSKPYRVFDQLHIRGGLYVLEHNNVRWHPNRDDYSVQQFLAGQKCTIDMHHRSWDAYANCSLAKMRSYLNPTIRIKWTSIYVAEEIMNNPEHIVEMESIEYLGRNGNIDIWRNLCKMLNRNDAILKVQDVEPILNSPTILQCRTLYLYNANFSFKDYKVLNTVKVIETWYCFPDHWQEFLEQPGIKPLIVFRYAHPEIITNMLDHLSKVFSSAVLPNAFKMLFTCDDKSLIEFRETNKTSGEKLELKKGIPVEYQEYFSNVFRELSNTYTLERSST